MLAPHHPGAQKTETMQGVGVSRFKYFLPESREVLADGKGIQNNYRASIMGRIQVIPFIVCEYFAARRILKRKNYTLVNSHWLVPSGMVMAALKKKFGFKHIVTVHAADYYLLKRLPAGAAVMRWIVRSADAVLPVSKTIAEGIKPCAYADMIIKIIPMAVDTKLFKPPDPEARQKIREEFQVSDRFVLLFVGKLSDKKGVEYIIEAVEKLLPEIPDIKALIVGEGHKRKDLEKMSKDRGLEDMVKFIGPVAQDELPRYYHAADLLLVPSIIDRFGETEGMPVVILEALASGLRVVGTTCCGAPEELHKAGFIEIEPADAEALKKAIKEAKTNNAKSYDHSIIQNFSWSETAKKYSETFYEMMAK